MRERYWVMKQTRSERGRFSKNRMVSSMSLSEMSDVEWERFAQGKEWGRHWPPVKRAHLAAVPDSFRGLRPTKSSK